MTAPLRDPPRVKRATTWPLVIGAFDKMPPEAREALANSRFLGNGSDQLRIAKAPGEIMAERIRRADEMVCRGDNLIAMPASTNAAVNAVLQGRQK